MTALLTDNLPLLAGAPNGINKLRELILELAVRGKLVPQDLSDEPAGELLKRIAEEKARLVAEGKIKKQKPQAEIDEEEKPFAMPTNWEWVRLDSLLKKIGAGSTPLGGKQAYVTDGVKFLRSQNVWNEGLRLNSVAFIPEETHQKMSGTHVEAGDLLFNITGASIGRCAAVPYDFDTGNVSQHVTIVRPVSVKTQPFLHVVLVSQLVQRTVMDVQVGVSREGLSIGKLAQFLIPFPPEAEQHRIVAKVDELMALCDRLETQQADAESAHAQLVQALLDSLTQTSDAAEFAANWKRLAEHFHTLFTTEPSIDALKQTLLQLAVMGKLVPQDPSDEPASELIKKIESEKYRQVEAGKFKPVKQVNGIEAADKPFQLPATWEWARLADIAFQITDGAHHTPTYIETGVPFLSVKDMSGGSLSFNATRYISEEAHEQLTKRCHPQRGDLLLTKIGTTGVPVIVHTDRPFSIFVSVGLIKAPWDYLNVSYLQLLINSPFVRKQSLDGTEGVGNKNLVLRKIANFLIAIPPLAEQHRIVAKVDQLMALCDQLKTRLTQARQLNEQLASTLVEQAVA